MPSAASLAIAQVAPYPLEAGHPVTAHARRLADELAARGHRVVVLAPSRDPQLVRQTRHDLLEDAAALLPAPGGPPTILAVAEALSGTDRHAAIPVDAARAVEDALTLLELDLVHVHEPFGPSVATAALRHSHALNVATFHLPAERIGSGMGAGVGGTTLGRKRAERLLGRIDDRLAASEAAAAVVAHSFPIGIGYTARVPPPADAGREPPALPAGPPVPDASSSAGDRPALRGAAVLGEPAPFAHGEAPGHGVDGNAPASGSGATPGDGALAGSVAPFHIVVPLDEERPARRAALRALRRLDPALPWRATVVVSDDGTPTPPLRASLRDRISFVPLQRLPADADVVLLASSGTRPAPHTLIEALHQGAVPVASRIDVYDELTDGGRRGLLFEPGDIDVLVAQTERLLRDRELREGLRAAAANAPVTERSWDAYTDWVLGRYDGLRSKRHDPDRFDPAVVARIRSRPLIDVDLHMHTDHSGDCATPVEVLLDAARRQGLGAIAVTDHNEVSGAHEAAAKAEQYGIKVIIGEEVKTADQGEVIGLFINEKIPKGVTLEEAIADIRRQGGLVYVPHPFDRMHAVPDYEYMLDIVDEIDAVEIFNPRVAIGSFNEEAVRFAAKYRMVAGAGSDSHVAQGLGSVRIRMHDFDGPEEFLASLAQAEIQTKPGTLVYVQALKFLETKAVPAPARKIVRDRRVRRATRD